MSSSETAPLKYFRLWWILGWAWVALVWYLSLTAKPPLPELDVPFADKYGHFLAYGWLMGWFGNIYFRKHARLVFAAAFILMGIGLEFLQDMGEARMFEYYDMLANTAGVFIGFILTLGKPRNILGTIEKYL